VFSVSYEIRKERNKRCFEGSKLPNALTDWNNAHRSIRGFNSSVELLIQSASHPITMSDSAIRWTTPKPKFYKPNVDTANDEDKWGVAAAIIHDECCRNLLWRKDWLCLRMAMGTHRAGYHSPHPHTRVLRKSSYPSPYLRGQ